MAAVLPQIQALQVKRGQQALEKASRRSTNSGVRKSINPVPVTDFSHF